MPFTETMDGVTATVNAMRKKMNHMCQDSLDVLVDALFQNHPGLIAVYWQQTMTDSGLQLTARYTDQGTTYVVGACKQAPKPAMVASVNQFVQFLKSISYHLFCAYGNNAAMMASAEGIVALPA